MLYHTIIHYICAIVADLVEEHRVHGVHVQQEVQEDLPNLVLLLLLIIIIIRRRRRRMIFIVMIIVIVIVIVIVIKLIVIIIISYTTHKYNNKCDNYDKGRSPRPLGPGRPGAAGTSPY